MVSYNVSECNFTIFFSQEAYRDVVIYNYMMRYNILEKKIFNLKYKKNI